MKAYMVITSKRPQDLDYEVNKLLRQGWKLQGGLSVNRDSHNDCLYGQAVVHRKTKKIKIYGLDT